MADSADWINYDGVWRAGVLAEGWAPNRGDLVNMVIHTHTISD